MELHNPALNFDIFVRVIDNHGDAGVTLRLARRLGELGHRCKLWIDDPEMLLRMSPTLPVGVTWQPWPLENEPITNSTADVWIEAFGCELPTAIQAQWKSHVQLSKANRTWINLEYFTTEDYAKRCHGLPSPVLHGPAQGATKWFYYPGWTSDLGGVIQRSFDRDLHHPLLSEENKPVHSPAPNAILFCYEPEALQVLCQRWKQRVHMRVAPGRPADAWRKQCSQVSAEFLPWTDQLSFDQWLAQSDFNFVRGEDSILTAMAAGKPYLWQIYPQEDGVHADKLHAFLNTLDAPLSVKAAHAIWNGLEGLNQADAGAWLPLPDSPLWAEWAEFAQHSARQMQQAPDLAQKLVGFVMSGKI
jgi:uncharacterized repeat protein (TIGR03837 family)